MIDDALVRETHETRRRMLEECDGDLGKLMARFKAAEAEDKDRLVTIEDVQKRAGTRKAPS